MAFSMKFLAFLVLQVSATLSQEEDYYVEAFQQEGDLEALILKIKPDSSSSGFQILRDFAQKSQQRQDEDDDDDIPATTPFIPQIIPGLNKIFNGLVTGNLNMIFHGATSFAPKNVSYDINTVYNQVVGIPPPKTTIRTTTEEGAVVMTVTKVVNGTAVAVPVAPPVPTAAPTLSTDEDEDGDGDGEARAKIRNEPKNNRFLHY